MNDVNNKTKELKCWKKPSVLTLTHKELAIITTAAACSVYGSGCVGVNTTSLEDYLL